jgi:hypothetical protein
VKEDLIKIFKAADDKRYQNEQAMFNDLSDVVEKYNGRISLVATLGVLDLIKDKVKRCNE